MNPFRYDLDHKIEFKPFVKDSKKRKDGKVSAIAEDVSTITETFEELNELIHDQQAGFDEIEENRDLARLSIKTAKRDIFKSSRYQNSMVYVIGGTIIGGLVGGPVGAVVLGLKAGIGLSIGGSIIGGVLGRQKGKKDKRHMRRMHRELRNPQESHTELSKTVIPKSIMIFEEL